MPHRDDTTLRIGDGGGQGATLAYRETVAILVGDGRQAAIGPEEPLLSAAVIGQRIGGIVVVFERRIDARRTAKAAIAVMSEIGVVVATWLVSRYTCRPRLKFQLLPIS